MSYDNERGSDTSECHVSRQPICYMGAATENGTSLIRRLAL